MWCFYVLIKFEIGNRKNYQMESQMMVFIESDTKCVLFINANAI